MPASYCTEQIQAAAILTAQWLTDERATAVYHGENAHDIDPADRYNTVVGDIMPEHWRRFQSYQEIEDEVPIGIDVPADAALQTNQQILKVCAAAGEARVWELVIHGSRFDQAEWRSQTETTVYLRDTGHLASVLADPGELRRSFGMAIVSHARPAHSGESQPQLLTERTANLAVARLLEQGKRDGEILVPIPGLPSGILEVDPRSHNWSVF